jgi:hypothetical protein
MSDDWECPGCEDNIVSEWDYNQLLEDGICVYCEGDVKAQEDDYLCAGCRMEVDEDIAGIEVPHFE